jgi:putative NADPH-quinone reductase
MSALIIDGHPNAASLTAALAQRYAEGYGDATVLALRELNFDPVLHYGYQGEQALEPDLLKAQALIEAASHIVVVTPVWWGSIPALLKGFFDRAFRPRWAFTYRPSGLPNGLLAGRSGRIIVVTDSPIWYLRMVGDTTVRHVRGRILRFCGIAPVKATRLGPVRTSTPQQREAWLEKIARIAANDAADHSHREVSPKVAVPA